MRNDERDLLDVLKFELQVLERGGYGSSPREPSCMNYDARENPAPCQHGIGHLDTVRADLIRWMEEHEYSSVGQMCGSMSQKNVPDPTAFERANYMRVLSSYSLRS